MVAGVGVGDILYLSCGHIVFQEHVVADVGHGSVRCCIGIAVVLVAIPHLDVHLLIAFVGDEVDIIPQLVGVIGLNSCNIFIDVNDVVTLGETLRYLHTALVDILVSVDVWYAALSGIFTSRWFHVVVR